LVDVVLGRACVLSIAPVVGVFLHAGGHGVGITSACALVILLVLGRHTDGDRRHASGLCVEQLHVVNPLWSASPSNLAVLEWQAIRILAGRVLMRCDATRRMSAPVHIVAAIELPDGGLRRPVGARRAGE